MVLGMHRSGTSALTRVISLLGAELPRAVLGANPTNPTGHWEPARLVELHDRMLAEAGSRWDDWRPFSLSDLSRTSAEFYQAEIASILDDEFGSSPLFVLKEPRIARFVRLYADILEAMNVEVRYVHISRNPLAVMASLEQRDRFTPPYSALLWLRHTLDAERSTRGACRVFVAYDELVADWPAIAKQLDNALGVKWPRPEWEASADIAGYVLPEHQHHRGSDLLLAADRRVNRWVKDAHHSLKALRADPGDSQALLQFDQIGEQFDAAARDIGPAFFDELARRQALLVEAERHWQRIAELRSAELAQVGAADEAKIEAEAARWREALGQRDAELAAATSAERHWRDTAERLKAEVDQAYETLAEISASREAERADAAARQAELVQQLETMGHLAEVSANEQVRLSTELAAANDHFMEQLASKDRLLAETQGAADEAEGRCRIMENELTLAATAEAELRLQMSVAEQESSAVRHRLAETEALVANLAAQIDLVRNSRLWRTATSLKIWAKGSPSVPLTEPPIQQAANTSARDPEKEGDSGSSRVRFVVHHSHHAER